MCLMPWFLSSLSWFLAALCSFIFGHVRVGLKTQLRTYGCISLFWWQFFFGRFAHTMQTWKGLFSFQRNTFFPESRPEGARKYGKTRLKYGHIRPVQFGPVRTKRTLKKKDAPSFFTSVCPSVKRFSSWHHKIRASRCAQTPCVFCRNVGMCTCLPPPPQLIVKKRQESYISTRIVDPKLSNQEVLVKRLGLNDVWGCLIQHQAGQAQNAHII